MRAFACGVKCRSTYNLPTGSPRALSTSETARYVAPDVTGYQDLDDKGSWSSEPEYGNVWTPSHVAVGWAPYSFGRWVWVSPWGYTWIDNAPWGYHCLDRHENFVQVNDTELNWLGYTRFPPANDP